MNRALRITALVITLSYLAPTAFAKDQSISLDQCPTAVQAVIRQYSAQGTFESVALDEKKKSGGPAVYEAKFAMRSGKRFELHISADGRVLQVEDKKPKS